MFTRNLTENDQIINALRHELDQRKEQVLNELDILTNENHDLRSSLEFARSKNEELRRELTELKHQNQLKIQSDTQSVQEIQRIKQDFDHFKLVHAEKEQQIKRLIIEKEQIQ